jgi:hypothetical protein
MPHLRNSNFSAVDSVRILSRSKKPEFKLDNPQWSMTATPVITHRSEHNKTMKPKSVSKGGSKKKRSIASKTKKAKRTKGKIYKKLKKTRKLRK